MRFRSMVVAIVFFPLPALALTTEEDIALLTAKMPALMSQLTGLFTRGVSRLASDSCHIFNGSSKKKTITLPITRMHPL